MPDALPDPAGDRGGMRIPITGRDLVYGVLLIFVGGGGAFGGRYVNGNISQDDLDEVWTEVREHTGEEGHSALNRRVMKLEGSESELRRIGENQLLICQALDVECRR